MTRYLSKPYREDSEIEELLYQGQIKKPEENILFTQQEKERLLENSKILEMVLERIFSLEEKISKLETNQEEYKIQNLLDQNEISRMELENIFELNGLEESTTLEGLLSEFVDKNENSLEMIQSVRHNS